MKLSWAAIAMRTTAFAVCMAIEASRIVAEPIVGQQSPVALPQTATQLQEVTDALALFEVRDYDGSLKLWQEAVKKDPNLPPAQVIMAQLFSQEKMLDEASEALDRALVEVPDDPEAYLLKAGIAMQHRDTAMADMWCKKAYDLIAKFEKSARRKRVLQSQIYQGLTNVAQAREDWETARKVLEEWLALDSTNAAVLQQVAYCLFRQGSIDGALDKLRNAAETDSRMSAPEAVLAMWYERSGDGVNAQKYMAAAVAAAPKDLRTRLAASEWALKRGQLNEARKHAIAARRIDSQSFQAQVLRGSIAMLEEDYESAEVFFGSALKQSPGNLVASNNLALALIEQEDASKKQRALEYAEANIQKHPQLVDAVSTYGLVLYKLGRLDDAERVLSEIASNEDLDLDTAYIIACVFVDRERKKEARKLLENMLKRTTPCMYREEAEELLNRLKE